MIRVTCPVDGDVWLQDRNVVLTVSPGGASYLFRCCRCQRRYYKDCSARIAKKLEPVAVVNRIVPEPHVGPPLTADEVFRELAP
jgi:hypothetical protein